MKEDKLKNTDEDIIFQEREFHSLTDLIYNTVPGRWVLALTAFSAVIGGILVGTHYLGKLFRQEKPIVQQVMSGEKPEIYIERNGVKYFSHVDGKEISDIILGGK